MTAGFVREARASDAAGLARIQVESWRSSLAGLVPDEVLAELGEAEASGQFAERWRDAITNPPTSRHKVHVAVDPADPVGFASAGPATDEDKWPATDAELYELHVLPSADDAGHGARLLHAVADTLAEDGFRTACTWALSGDAPRLSFLEAAGWVPDGVHSNLDMGVKVHVVRLHTQLS
ncbi:MAG: GNAT family N-acetyltransferase [Nocardiopsaceae bacterium]|nr:GNAT family N-acetyltransferase [Nocardiopsaceae bacterium]